MTLRDSTRFWPSGLLVLLVVGLAVFGCAAPQKQATGPSPLETEVAQLRADQVRISNRLDELAENLILLRERLDTGERSTLQQVAEPPRVLAAEPVEPAEVEEVKPPAEEVIEPTAPEQEPPKTVVVKASDEAAIESYRKAFNAFRQGSFGSSILEFEDFLRKYPDHEHSDKAQYWIGESYFSQGVFDQAIVEFGRVVDRYPREPRAPDAYLMMGKAYMKLGEASKAKVFWGRLIDRYPESDAAQQAGALLKNP